MLLFEIEHEVRYDRLIYTGPIDEFFEFEREAVFARSWICAGRAEQIPNAGDYLALNVAGEPLLVVRTTEKKIHVMSAVCQHRGHVLTCTSGSTRTFRCPLHFWSYDLTGKLLGAPRMGSVEGLERLRANGLGDVRVFLGGIIPDEDVPVLKQMGVPRVISRAISPTSAKPEESAAQNDSDWAYCGKKGKRSRTWTGEGWWHEGQTADVRDSETRGQPFAF